METTNLRDVPVAASEETAAVLRDLQVTGKIRAIGVSNYSIEAMERFQRVAPIASAQPPLNVFERDSERDILPWCRSHGVGVITYGALCRGLLTGTLDEKTQFTGDDLRQTDPKLDDEAKAYVEHFLAETVKDPVGPEFMAPPESAAPPQG